MDVSAIMTSLEKLCVSKPEAIEELVTLRAELQKLLAESEDLREERDRFKSYVENANDTIAILDLEGKVIYTTENWTRQLGVNSGDVVHNRIFERYMHPEDAPRAQAFFETAIKSKESQSGFEYRIKHSDGSWRWHTANIAPILNEKGEVESVVSIARSIHRQKMAELRVRESEARLRVILDTMREGVIMVDNDDHIKFINKCLCDLYGLSAEEAIGKIGNEVLIIPEDRHIIIEKNLARLDGLVDEYEIRGRKPNGELIWLQINGAPLRNDDGSVVGSVGIMTDITQKKKTLEALKRSEEKFRHLFEDSITGVFQSSFQDHYLNVNSAFARMFGYDSPEEMINSKTDIKEFYVHPEQREALKEKVIQDGFVENFEVELRRKDGSLFWVSLYAKLRADDAGRMILEGTCIDITESKSLREQLMASQKLEAIGKLAGGIAHDFNNLLTVILGYSEDIMEDISPDSKIYDAAEEIVKAGQRAATLTRQLIAFSRKQIIHSEQININGLINNLHGIINRLTGEEYRVEFQLSEDLAPVKVDPNQMEQVIVNMVINAKEAMPQGGTLSIRTSNVLVDQSYKEYHRSIKEGKYVMLTISDSGIGMDKATLHQIFEPFFSTKNDAKSVGLGLSSAFGIIEQAGGAIIPYSEPGKGTTMKILLPAMTDSGYPASEEPSLTGVQGKGHKILVVEDEESLGKMVQKMLSSMGYRVEYTGSSLRALKRFQDGESFDLVISDVVMPQMNGKELSDAILKINPQQKILFMSGFADDVIAQHGILDPSLPFIQKPFSARQIAPIIYKLVNASQQNLRLMILDDEEGICKLFQRSSEKRGHICDKACTMSAAMRLLAEHKYDMLLVDMNLNELSGSEAIKTIRDSGCDTPIIILSGMIQPGTLDGFGDSGVIRAFEKSFDNTPILRYIENYIQQQE